MEKDEYKSKSPEKDRIQLKPLAEVPKHDPTEQKQEKELLKPPKPSTVKLEPLETASKQEATTASSKTLVLDQMIDQELAKHEANLQSSQTIAQLEMEKLEKYHASLRANKNSKGFKIRTIKDSKIVSSADATPEKSARSAKSVNPSKSDEVEYKSQKSQPPGQNSENDESEGEFDEYSMDSEMRETKQESGGKLAEQPSLQEKVEETDKGSLLPEKCASFG